MIERQRMERVLVCGDRTWNAMHIIMQVLQEMKPKLVIQGGAKGADLLAKECALKLHIPHHEFVADWIEHGRAAGPIRNKKMLEEGKPVIVLAFHDNLEKSRGTKHMISIANKAGVPVHLYNSKGEVSYNYTIL